MPEAVIVATARSPIGRAFKGSLSSIRPARADEKPAGYLDGSADVCHHRRYPVASFHLTILVLASHLIILVGVSSWSFYW